MGLIEKLQAKLELFRLEQRYTRNRHRRSTFISNAVYKDGEYIYQTPTTTGSSTNSASTTSSSPWSPGTAAAATAIEEEEQEPRRYRGSLDVPNPQPQKQTARSAAERKKMNRWSSMPGFGSTTSGKSNSPSRDWRPNTVEVQEVR